MGHAASNLLGIAGLLFIPTYGWMRHSDLFGGPSEAS
jgi:hypothetical protein